MCDSRGTPLVAEITPGQQHESTCFEEVLDAVRIPQAVGRPRRRPEKVAGDKGYSVRRIREWLRRHHMEAVIPQREDQVGRPDGCRSLDRKAYRRRNVIERCVGWLKECRRLATRFEKLALNFLAMLDLWMIERYLRIGFSDRA